MIQLLNLTSTQIDIFPIHSRRTIEVKKVLFGLLSCLKIFLNQKERGKSHGPSDIYTVSVVPFLRFTEVAESLRFVYETRVESKGEKISSARKVTSMELSMKQRKVSKSATLSASSEVASKYNVILYQANIENSDINMKRKSTVDTFTNTFVVVWRGDGGVPTEERLIEIIRNTIENTVESKLLVIGFTEMEHFIEATRLQEIAEISVNVSSKHTREATSSRSLYFRSILESRVKFKHIAKWKSADAIQNNRDSLRRSSLTFNDDGSSSSPAAPTTADQDSAALQNAVYNQCIKELVDQAGKEYLKEKVSSNLALAFGASLGDRTLSKKALSKSVSSPGIGASLQKVTSLSSMKMR